MTMTSAKKTVVLLGKPNAGKSAIFNTLTGAKQKVANYPGVTVERKQGHLTSANGTEITLLDLPGTYSLDPHSPDEEVTHRVVHGKMSAVGTPDVIICVADATNLSLSLPLILEARTLQLPLVVAVNMMDIATKRGCIIDCDILSQELGVPVIPTIAYNKASTDALRHAIDEACIPTLDDNCTLALGDIQRRAVAIAHTATLKAPRLDAATRRLDTILLHPLWGMVSFFAIVFLIFQAVFSFAAAPMDFIDGSISSAVTWINAHYPDSLFKSLIADGILAGVGSVIIFLPQIIILFFFILLLEDSGYMARAAFLLDKSMGRVGLHGKAFIPLLSSFACAIPGIMATRTIENPRDRLITIMIAPLMTCSARLPVYTLIIAAFVPNQAVGHLFNLQGVVMFALYLAGIIAAMIVAYVMKRMVKGERAPLLLEMPDYRMPNWRNLAFGLLERSKIFLRRAGTIILALMIIVWVLSTFPQAPANATEPAITYSFAGIIGKFLSPIFAPIGFNWQIVIALIPAMAAREIAVAALGTVYALSNVDANNADSLAQMLAHSWTLPTAVAFLVWFIFAPQCLATLGVIRRETNSRAWTWFAFSYLMGLAYLMSFVAYHITLAITS